MSLNNQKWPKVCVVILNWNGHKDTIECVDSLLATTYPSLEIVIIDNASTDASVPAIQEFADNCGTPWKPVTFTGDENVLSADETGPDRSILFIKSSENLGFCRGNNLGMLQAIRQGADYIMVLNNDTLVDSGFLEPLVVAAVSEENVGLVGGIIQYCDNRDMVWWAGGVFDPFLRSRRLHDRQPLSSVPASAPYATDWVSGCMMFIPRTTYDRFGGFEESYFIWAEEWDYSCAVKRAGLKLLVAPDARACHKVGRSLGIMKPLSYYYGTRNRLMFQRKYLSWHLWYPFFVYFLFNRMLRYAQLSVQGRRDLVTAGTDAIVDFLRGRTGIWKKQVADLH